jgi:hypothetical protein
MLRKIIVSLLCASSSALAGFDEDYRNLYAGYSVSPDVRVEVHSTSGQIDWFDAHSTCLGKSGYFEAVLGNQKDETVPHFRDTRGNVFPLKDMEPEVFRRVLYFLYQNKMILDSNVDVVELFKAQDRLLISGMKELILHELKSSSYLNQLSVDQLADLLVRAKSYLPLYQQLLDSISADKDEKPGTYMELKHKLNDHKQIQKDLNEILSHHNFVKLSERAKKNSREKEEKKHQKLLQEAGEIKDALAKRIHRGKVPPFKFSMGTKNKMESIVAVLKADPDFTRGFMVTSDFANYRIVISPK